jgi:hypothetical protein
MPKPQSPPSDGGEGWGEEARFYWFSLSSVLFPLAPRRERKVQHFWVTETGHTLHLEPCLSGWHTKPPPVVFLDYSYSRSIDVA